MTRITTFDPPVWIILIGLIHIELRLLTLPLRWLGVPMPYALRKELAAWGL